MNKNLQKLARRYTATLLKYLSGEQETVLEQAYELGRTAIAQGFGVLDMARVHQQALAKLMRSKAWRAIRFSPEQPDQQPTGLRHRQCDHRMGRATRCPSGGPQGRGR